MKQSLTELKDEELVSLTLCGCGDAYSELIRRHRRMILCAAAETVRDARLAEEIAQDAFTDAYLQLRKLRDVSKFAAWVYGIARRKALHIVSRRRSYAELDDLTEMAADAPSPEEAFLEREKHLAVRDAVAALSPKNREAVELYYMQELSVPEIARRTGLAPGTIKSRLYEARIKLKGALEHMEETRQEQNFEAAVRERVNTLLRYNRQYGDESREFGTLYEETRELIRHLPDGSEKSRAQQIFYGNLWSSKYDTAQEYNAILEKTDPGRLKARQTANAMWEEQDFGRWKKRTIELVTEALRDDAVRRCPESAVLLFWRGRAYIGQKSIAEARADFEAALRIAERDSIIRSLCRVSLNSLDLLEEYADDPIRGLQVTAETYVADENGVYFVNQPGFGEKSVLWTLHKYDYINYFISRCRDTFYKTSMQPGDSITDEDGSSLTLVDMRSSITVPAGSYEACMHLLYRSPDYETEMWYAPEVGLVKAAICDKPETEVYELSEVELHGGSGYFPFAIGNRWRYINPALPEGLFTRFENEIDWTDGMLCRMMVTHLVAFRKGFRMEEVENAYVAIDECDRLCREWKTEEAIEALKMAVRWNTNAETTIAALYGIEYLRRFADAQARGFRFCPSSFHLSGLSTDGGRVVYQEGNFASFGPYRFGTRGEENRIFGVKPVRYLQQLTGCVWDDRWAPGYVDSFPVQLFGHSGQCRLEVTDGGTVETPAGVFTQTRKLTLEASQDDMEGASYFDASYTRVWAGKKEFWFAPGVGIVRFDFTWGSELDSSALLCTYSCPAAEADAYFPVEIGNYWEYDETHLTAEGYRAKRCIGIRGGMADRYFMTDSQEFWFLGTEEEYEEAKRSGFKGARTSV